jgi:hypothetical protein
VTEKDEKEEDEEAQGRQPPTQHATGEPGRPVAAWKHHRRDPTCWPRVWQSSDDREGDPRWTRDDRPLRIRRWTRDVPQRRKASASAELVAVNWLALGAPATPRHNHFVAMPPRPATRKRKRLDGPGRPQLEAPSKTRSGRIRLPMVSSRVRASAASPPHVSLSDGPCPLARWPACPLAAQGGPRQTTEQGSASSDADAEAAFAQGEAGAIAPGSADGAQREAGATAPGAADGAARERRQAAVPASPPGGRSRSGRFKRLRPLGDAAAADTPNAPNAPDAPDALPLGASSPAGVDEPPPFDSSVPVGAVAATATQSLLDDAPNRHVLVPLRHRPRPDAPPPDPPLTLDSEKDDDARGHARIIRAHPLPPPAAAAPSGRAGSSGVLPAEHPTLTCRPPPAVSVTAALPLGAAMVPPAPPPGARSPGLASRDLDEYAQLMALTVELLSRASGRLAALERRLAGGDHAHASGAASPAADRLAVIESRLAALEARLDQAAPRARSSPSSNGPLDASAAVAEHPAPGPAPPASSTAPSPMDDLPAARPPSGPAPLAPPTAPLAPSTAPLAPPTAPLAPSTAPLAPPTAPLPPPAAALAPSTAPLAPPTAPSPATAMPADPPLSTSASPVHATVPAPSAVPVRASAAAPSAMPVPMMVSAPAPSIVPLLVSAPAPCALPLPVSDRLAVPVSDALTTGSLACWRTHRAVLEHVRRLGPASDPLAVTVPNPLAVSTVSSLAPMEADAASVGEVSVHTRPPAALARGFLQPAPSSADPSPPLRPPVALSSLAAVPLPLAPQSLPTPVALGSWAAVPAHSPPSKVWARLPGPEGFVVYEQHRPDRQAGAFEQLLPRQAGASRTLEGESPLFGDLAVGGAASRSELGQGLAVSAARPGAAVPPDPRPCPPANGAASPASVATASIDAPAGFRPMDLAQSHPPPPPPEDVTRPPCARESATTPATPALHLSTPQDTQGRGTAPLRRRTAPMGGARHGTATPDKHAPLPSSNAPATAATPSTAPAATVANKPPATLRKVAGLPPVGEGPTAPACTAPPPPPLRAPATPAGPLESLVAARQGGLTPAPPAHAMADARLPAAVLAPPATTAASQAPAIPMPIPLASRAHRAAHVGAIVSIAASSSLCRWGPGRDQRPVFASQAPQICAVWRIELPPGQADANELRVRVSRSCIALVDDRSRSPRICSIRFSTELPPGAPSASSSTAADPAWHLLGCLVFGSHASTQHCVAALKCLAPEGALLAFGHVAPSMAMAICHKSGEFAAMFPGVAAHKSRQRDGPFDFGRPFYTRFRPKHFCPAVESLLCGDSVLPTKPREARGSEPAPTLADRPREARGSGPAPTLANSMRSWMPPPPPRPVSAAPVGAPRPFLLPARSDKAAPPPSAPPSTKSGAAPVAGAARAPGLAPAPASAAGAAATPRPAARAGARTGAAGETEYERDLRHFREAYQTAAQAPVDSYGGLGQDSNGGLGQDSNGGLGLDSSGGLRPLPVAPTRPLASLPAAIGASGAAAALLHAAAGAAEPPPGPTAAASPRRVPASEALPPTPAAATATRAPLSFLLSSSRSAVAGGALRVSQPAPRAIVSVAPNGPIPPRAPILPHASLHAADPALAPAPSLSNAGPLAAVQGPGAAVVAALSPAPPPSTTLSVASRPWSGAPPSTLAPPRPPIEAAHECLRIARTQRSGLAPAAAVPAGASALSLAQGGAREIAVRPLFLPRSSDALAPVDPAAAPGPVGEKPRRSVRWKTLGFSQVITFCPDHLALTDDGPILAPSPAPEPPVEPPAPVPPVVRTATADPDGPAMASKPPLPPFPAAWATPVDAASARVSPSPHPIPLLPE